MLILQEIITNESGDLHFSICFVFLCAIWHWHITLECLLLLIIVLAVKNRWIHMKDPVIIFQKESSEILILVKLSFS